MSTRSWMKKRNTPKTAGDKALRAVRKLSKAIPRPEVKIDEVYYTGNPSYAGVITSMCNPAQGTSVYLRIGNHIQLRASEFHYTVTIDRTLANAAVRLMLVTDTSQVGSTAPLTTDILEISSTVYAYLSPLNPLNEGRFIVHYDKTHSLDNLGNTSATVMKKITFKGGKGIDVGFTGGSSTWSKNGLWLLAITSSNATNPLVQFYHHAHFNDA